MQFDSLAAAWSMNGHGPFVWSAYMLAALILLATVWVPLQRHRRFFSEQRGIERRRNLRSADSAADNSSTSVNSGAKAP
jgi:heme exporter protein D